MQGVLAIAGGRVVLGPRCRGSSINGAFVVSREPVGAAKVEGVGGGFGAVCSRFDISRHSFPVGKRLSRSCTRVSALQQSASTAKWVLDPAGDGNTSHLDSPVPLPSGFELASDAVTVGRVKDRVDVVIPVATVSAVHARLEKKDGQLLVTDLDSTNGTFINNKRIRPGAVTSAPLGSYITFGDEHLAVFRFLQLDEPEEAPTEAPAAAPTEAPVEVLEESQE